MGRLSVAVVFFVVGVAVACCGPTLGSTFPFRYYNLEAQSYSGMLRGGSPEDDLSLDRCKPEAGKANPCQVFFKDELLRLKQEYRNLQLENEDLRRKLNSCQSQT